MSAHPDDIMPRVPLQDKNWFRTGGAARYYSEPNTTHQLVDALSFAKKNALPYFVLGEGANVLISDDGFSGLVIRPKLTKILFEQQANSQVFVTAQAGVSMERLIKTCLKQQASGLEEFSGIPGTVGGSVYINIHYFRHLLSHFIVSATVLDTTTLQVEKVDAAWFNFAYNYSTLHEKTHLLLDATFALTTVDATKAAYAWGRHDEIIRHRKFRYPSEHTCGSFFANFNREAVIAAGHDEKLIYVAYYLDKVGSKGSLRVGDAMVSHRHANMLINLGSATTSDIIELARRMQELVWERFGLLARPECQLIGFENYPLHTDQSITRHPRAPLNTAKNASVLAL